MTGLIQGRRKLESFGVSNKPYGRKLEVSRRQREFKKRGRVGQLKGWSIELS
jgi:hypothetical protein